MNARWKFGVRVVLSLAVSCVFIVFSLRHANLRAVGAAIAAVSLWPVLGYLAALLLIHLVKTVRWWLLLEQLGHVSFARVNSASAIGFMLMVVLPLRLGEFARPLLISRPAQGDGVRLPRSGALAACVVERTVDSLAVGILGVISLHLLATTGNAADFARHAAAVVTAGCGLVCVGLAFAFFMRERAVGGVEWALGKISRPLAGRAASLLDGFIRGLHLGSASRAFAFVALTIAYWALHAWGFWIVAGAFGLHITVLMACTVLACQVVGIMIPAGPGMVGTSQFFTQLGLSIFIPGALSDPDVAARAAGYANTIWLLQFGQQVVLGLLYLAAGHVSLAGILGPAAPAPAEARTQE